MNLFNNSTLSNNAIFVLLGLILVFAPGISIDLIVYVLGITKTLSGALGIYRQYKFDTQYSFQFNTNVLNLLFGLALLTIPSFSTMLLSIVPIVFGIWIAGSGVNQISNALKFKQVRQYWWVGLIIGILCSLLGLFIIFNPISVIKDVFRFIGLFFLVKGGFGAFNCIKEGKNENPDVIG